jgi:predicted outer membrane repeat protein
MSVKHTFENNRANSGGGLSVHRGNLTTSGTLLVFLNSAKHMGGGIHVHNSAATLHGSTLVFRKNLARLGGALYIGRKGKTSKTLLVTLSAQNLHFIENKANDSGGAIYITFSKLLLGSAIMNLTSDFSAVQKGVVFEDNSANSGGAIYCRKSEIVFQTNEAWLSGNTASKGGAVAILGNNISDIPMNISGNFVHNTAHTCGGSVFAQTTHIIFSNISILNSTGSGFCIFDSRVQFTHNTLMTGNTGNTGGGVRSENSELTFPDRATFTDNKATYFGGAIYTVYGRVSISGISLLKHNTALRDGGAMFALGTDVVLNGTVTFTSNKARNGGALCLKSFATVSVSALLNLSTSNNYATKYGGVVYNEDNTMPSQCNFQETVKFIPKKGPALLPHCFLRLIESINHPVTVHSYRDLAGEDGHFLYGGLLDRCRIPDLNTKKSVMASQLKTFLRLQSDDASANTTSRTVASKPYRLCFCSSHRKHDCYNSRNIEVYRGQKFAVPLVAIDQTGSFVSTTVTATTSSKSWHFEQNVSQNCADVNYQIDSSNMHEQLTLYPDGPCRDIGFATAVINLTFKRCPLGFKQSGGMCVCEDRLQKYYVSCIIDTDYSIIRGAQSHFWVGTLYENDSYRGLILYAACPVEYCRKGSVNITLQDLNGQCGHNHTGVLCGSCETNYSFLLGSSRCGECPNSFYLALLLPFAAAGIALVVFLTILRLTVASGMINGVILYANIVQINRKSYFPLGESNILTVFIAWLNLDLGFETCFYNGMDAYAQTWLQYAFPLYVWVLISLIIVVSRYSITVSAMIGRNPVAVLATLLLMSYAKIIKTSIEVYSFAKLDYPENETVIVWLKDGNIPFFDPLQLLLTVVTLLIFVFLFLPYTLLLLVGYKLYRFTDRKFLKWLNRFKPFLDSYYAPYKSHTRYWTGFLLLVRCCLYTVFTINNDAGNNTSIILIFSSAVVISWISNGIYSKHYINMLEATIYLNLIVLSAITLAGFSSAALVYSLVGIVFATVMGVIVFHFARFPTVAAWFSRLQMWIKPTAALTTEDTTIEMKTTSNQATTSEVCLREPLLENETIFS